MDSINPSKVHQGHRSRIRDRIRKDGISSLSHAEILEYLLFHTIPRRDVNPIPFKLISRFGGLYNVIFKASVKELVNEGLSEKSATFLNLFPLFNYNYDEIKAYNLSTPKATLEYVANAYDKNDEGFVLLCLDSHRNLKKQLIISLLDYNDIEQAVDKIRSVVIDLGIYELKVIRFNINVLQLEREKEFIALLFNSLISYNILLSGYFIGYNGVFTSFFVKSNLKNIYRMDPKQIKIGMTYDIEESNNSTRLKGTVDKKQKCAFETLISILEPKDSKNVVNKLLSTFKNIKDIFNATEIELKQLNILSDNTILLFRNIPKILTACEPIQPNANYKQLIINQLRYQAVEKLMTVYLDEQRNVLSYDISTSNEGSSVQSDTSYTVKRAISLNAPHIVIAHNHPNNTWRPSEQDIVTSKSTGMILTTFGIKTIEFAIVTASSYYVYEYSKLDPYTPTKRVEFFFIETPIE